MLNGLITLEETSRLLLFKAGEVGMCQGLPLLPLFPASAQLGLFTLAFAALPADHLSCGDCPPADQSYPQQDQQPQRAAWQGITGLRSLVHGHLLLMTAGALPCLPVSSDQSSRTRNVGMAWFCPSRRNARVMLARRRTPFLPAMRKVSFKWHQST